MEQKVVCCRCKVSKLQKEFYVNKAYRGGYRPDCKLCVGKANQKSRLKRKRINPAHYMWKNARDRSKISGVPFEISVSDIVVPSACPVLGIPLVPSDGGHSDNSPSLDRLDQSRGYVTGNIAVVSWRANRIKCDATVAELRMIASFYGRERQS